MKNLLNICLFLFIGFSGYCQDTAFLKLNTFSINCNFLLSPTRIVTLPNEVQLSNFYQTQFKNFGVPNRKVYKQIESYQIGIDAGFKLRSLKKINHEWRVGIGFQSNENLKDRISKSELKYDSTIGFKTSNQLASINLTHTFNEIFFNTAFVVKTNYRVFNFYTGLGTNLSFYKPTILVEEIEKKILMNSYELSSSIQFAKLLYIPCGIEFNILNKNEQGIILGLQTLLRIDSDFSAGFSTSISYKL